MRGSREGLGFRFYLTVIALMEVVAGGAAFAAAASGNAEQNVDRAMEDLANAGRSGAAVAGLVRIGRPAAGALVKALSDPRSEVRSNAAAALRRILAADPEAAPDRHSEAYWNARFAELEPGLAITAALQRLRPHIAPGKEDKVMWAVWGNADRSGTECHRLDDYWLGVFSLQDEDKKTLRKSPLLSFDVRSAWVSPPGDYTGPWITWYVNGQKCQAIPYRGGKMNGALVSFFDTGVKGSEEYYKDGVPDGPSNGSYKNGKRRFQMFFKNGEPDGIWQFWYENGRPDNLLEYKRGKQHGRSATWHENGQLAHEEYYKNGEKDGLDRGWDEQGKPAWVHTYHAGKLVSER